MLDTCPEGWARVCTNRTLVTNPWHACNTIYQFGMTHCSVSIDDIAGRMAGGSTVKCRDLQETA